MSWGAEGNHWVNSSVTYEGVSTLIPTSIVDNDSDVWLVNSHPKCYCCHNALCACIHAFVCVHVCVYVRRTVSQTDRQTDRYLYLKLIPEELVMCLFPLLIAQTSMVLITIHTSIWIDMNAKLVR